MYDLISKGLALGFTGVDGFAAGRLSYRWVRAVHRFRLFLVIGLIVAACAIVLGYAFGWVVLFRQGAAGAHPVTLAGIVLLIVAVAAHRPLRPPRWPERLLPPLVFALGAGRLVEIWLAEGHPFSAAISRALIGPEYLDIATGVNTAITLMLLSMALILRRKWPDLGVFCASMAPFAPVFALIGYSYRVTGFYGEMALSSLGMLLGLSVAVLSVYAHRRSLRVLLSSSVIGRVSRLQLVVGVGFAWVAGLFLFLFQVAGGADYEALYVAAIIWFLAMMVFISSHAHEATDYRRRSIERRLAKFSVTDGLTGLANRRAVEILGDSLIEQAQMVDDPVAVMLVDIDHFKSINDGLGHDTGDDVLRQFARVFNKRLRRSDVVARWGGEEFLLLLPGAALGEAVVVANDLRQRLTAKVRVGDSDRRVTASFGVASLEPSDDSLAAVVARADAALYAAKAEGRDRVITCNDIAGRAAPPGADCPARAARPAGLTP